MTLNVLIVFVQITLAAQTICSYQGARFGISSEAKGEKCSCLDGLPGLDGAPGLAGIPGARGAKGTCSTL